MGVHSESNMMKLTLLILAAAATLVLGAPQGPKAPLDYGVYSYYEDQRADIERVPRDLFKKDSAIEEDLIFPSAPSGPAEAEVVPQKFSIPRRHEGGPEMTEDFFDNKNKRSADGGQRDLDTVFAGFDQKGETFAEERDVAKKNKKNKTGPL